MFNLAHWRSGCQRGELYWWAILVSDVEGGECAGAAALSARG
jgi:hypothetical protein